jgi:hypothetical protein
MIFPNLSLRSGCYAAQIMSFTDGTDTKIRLNEEVKAILIAIASRTLKPNERFNLEDGCDLDLH